MNTDNTIKITKSARGYRARFPYKPGDSAIRGFHGIGMIWDRSIVAEKTTWLIPENRLQEAQEFISYWYGEHCPPDKLMYTVEVEREATTGEVV